jgi:hypothetical protein
MPQILGHDSVQLPLVADQRPVQAVTAHRAHPPFGEGIRLRRPRRRPHHLDASRGEHGVERGGELAVVVADQIPQPMRLLVEVHQQVAGLLGRPSSGGVGGDPGQMHTPPLHLDDGQDVQPGRADGLDGEEVAGQQPAGLGA